MNTKTSLAFLCALGAVSSACSGGNTSGGPTGHTSAGVSALSRVQNCDELTQVLREDARKKMNLRIDAEIEAVKRWHEYGYNAYYGYRSAGGIAYDMAVPAAAPSGGTGAAPEAAPAATAHSDTNVQVKGVDEADIVKADNQRIYLLHGQTFKVLQAWPATELKELGSIDLEGDPSEMFVDDGKVVVYSQVDGTPIYQAAGVTPRSEYSDAYAPTLMGAGGAMVDVASAPRGMTTAGFAIHPLTKITVLSLVGNTPQVTRELYFEGNYQSSRRIGSQVRTVLTGGAHGPTLNYVPRVEATTQTSSPTTAGTSGSAANSEGTAIIPSPTGPSPTGPSPMGTSGAAADPVPPQTSTATTDAQWIAAYEKLRAENNALIDASTYQDWLPNSFVKSGSSVVAQTTACSDFHVPPPGTTEAGMTQITSVDLSRNDAPKGTAILGAVDTVYSSGTAMYLAGRAYVDPWLTRQQLHLAQSGTTASEADAGAATAPPVTMEWTHLHKFDLIADPTVPTYVGSGSVPGHVKDQFALDERDGLLRIATTEQRFSARPSWDGNDSMVNHLFVVENLQGTLTKVGDVGNLAPGESIYSTRFIGAKAYVVTFRVVDPLFAIDLSNPRAPKVTGELKIPGFSEYMHPLGTDHLLTIGRETTADGRQHDDAGNWYGLALQVFDVTSPASPQLKYKHVYSGGEYGTSEASFNHKAFTYFDDRKLLAFPYTAHDWSGKTGGGPRSTLEVFRVDVATGIQPIGGVAHDQFFPQTPNWYGYCGGYYQADVRRGIFLDDIVYSISYGGVIASNVNALDTQVASLALPKPVVQTNTGMCLD